MNYHRFRHRNGEEYGSFIAYRKGDNWFWEVCFARRLPDDRPNGPFETERDAIDDALNK